MKKLLFIAVFAVSGAVRAATWYVDADNFGKSGLDGSAANAFGTIQAAVDAAASGDVIKVAPGVYNQGEQSATPGGITTLSRVQIVNKSLTLEATGSRGETIIEGKRAATATGLGTGAVRCLRFSGTATTNSVVRGFTFRGGRTLSATEATSDSHPNSGGAVLGDWNTAVTMPARATLIDCDIIDCGATRGGAIRCVDAIRCRFVRCFTTNNSGVGRNCAVYNCLFAHTYRIGTGTLAVLEYFQQAVNCTFIDNDMRAVRAQSAGNGNTYNCYVGFNGGDGGSFLAETPGTQPVFLFNCVARASAVSTTYQALSADCAWTADQLQLASPATDDCHPLASAEASMAIGSAERYRARFPPRFAAEADKDLEGAPRFDADGTLRVGALQTAVTPASGFVYLADQTSVKSTDIVVDAHTSQVVSTSTTLCTYFSLPAWPATAEVEFLTDAAFAATQELFGVEFRNSDFTTYKFPLRGESRIVMMPPSKATKNTYLYPHYGTRRYVSPAGADTLDGGQGLSADRPWRTLQYAVDNSAADTVVHAAAGDYAEGGKTLSGDIMSRVAISTRVRLVADAGPAQTRILGAADPDVTDPNAAGCGPKAVRCVRADSAGHSCVQGFTLAGGRTQTNVNAATGYGGGYFAGAYRSREAYLVDSVITNCAGSRGAAFGGVLARCLIVGNTLESKGNGVLRGLTLVSSILRANDSVARNSNTADIGQDVEAINCTVDTSVNAYSLYSVADLLNTVVDGGKISGGAAARTFAGVLLSTNTQYYAALADSYGDPCFVDKAAGDYRVYSFSPAARWAATNDYSLCNAWRYVAGDYEGRPFVVTAAGTPLAGALQTAVPARAVYAETAGPGRDGATVVPQGLVPLTGDEPITVTAAGAARPCLGLEINGVFHAGLTETTIDPADIGPDESVAVRAVFGTDWYVDAENGDDARTGWSADAAMKTLTAVMAKTHAGDTVHALPGTYREGSAVQDGYSLIPASQAWNEPAIPSRVVVPANVALVATGSAEETVIEGALGTLRSDRASDGAYATYALGTNAVRCVYLNDGASVRGFTIRNGRVNASQEQDDGGWGAGVLCRNRNASEVVDCVVSNCASWRGGAGLRAKFVRCRIVENLTPGNSSAGRYCSYYGCYIARNQDILGQFGGLVANVGDFVGNTIAADNRSNWSSSATAGVRAIVSQDNSDTSRFWNNVILMPYVGQSYAQATMRNACRNFIAAEAAFPTPVGEHNDLSHSTADLKVGEDGVPTCDSPVVDAGDFAYALTNLVGEADLNGVPRGRNGKRIDVGAFEQPWLVRYAQDLGGRRLTVTAADLAVFENAEGKVEIPSGAVSLDWRPLKGDGSVTAVVALRVTGNGALKVYQDGVCAATYTAGTAEWKFDAAGGETYALDFAYEPGPGDTGSAVILSARADVGSCFFLR